MDPAEGGELIIKQQKMIEDRNIRICELEKKISTMNHMIGAKERRIEELKLQTDPKSITNDMMVQAALNAGFMLHSGYGQNHGKLMPVADTETLMKFAEAILHWLAEAHG